MKCGFCSPPLSLFSLREFVTDMQEGTRNTVKVGCRVLRIKLLGTDHSSIHLFQPTEDYFCPILSPTWFQYDAETQILLQGEAERD